MKTLAINSRVELVGPKPSALNLKAYSLQPMAAASRFGRYKPESSHEVRNPITKTKTLIEELRHRRDMLMSIDPEKVKTVVEVYKDLTVFEVLHLARQEGRILVPNFVHDRILTETTDLEDLKQIYVARTGTLAIYEAPDKPFETEVVFSWKHDWVIYSASFKVPQQFQGKRNRALIMNYPDFEILDLGNNKFEIVSVDERSVHQIEHFPKKSGWYKPDEEFRIPRGKQVKESKEARHLWRTKGTYVGLLHRDAANWGNDWRRYVYAVGQLSPTPGVVLF